MMDLRKKASTLNNLTAGQRCLVYSSVDGLGGGREVVKLSDGTGAVEVCLPLSVARAGSVSVLREY